MGPLLNLSPTPCQPWPSLLPLLPYAPRATMVVSGCWRESWFTVGEASSHIYVFLLSAGAKNKKLNEMIKDKRYTGNGKSTCFTFSLDSTSPADLFPMCWFFLSLHHITMLPHLLSLFLTSSQSSFPRILYILWCVVACHQNDPHLAFTALCSALPSHKE